MKLGSMDQDLSGGYTRPLILRAALDVEGVTGLLAPLLEPLVRSAGKISVEYAELLTYKRGRRGIIRYDVKAGDQAVVVLGKVYADLHRAVDVHATMDLLWTTVFNRSEVFGVPRPLGYLRDPAMLVYVPVEGRHLHEFTLRGGALDRFAQAGRWLATLHRSRMPLPRSLDLMAECAQMKAWAGLLGYCYPDLAPQADRLSEVLGDTATTLQIKTEVPIHKDFHYEHVVAGDGLWAIDFDEMRLGEPNCDLAHFRAYLDLLALRVGVPVTVLQAAFVGAYAEPAVWTPGRCFDWFYAFTCLKIIKQLCTMRGLHPRPVGVEQRRQVEAMLARAWRSIGVG